MSSTMPTRIDGDLFDDAKSVGAIENRSAAQQITYWARIGRELEASPGMSQSDIRRVLAGEAEYDNLGERDQAAVRVAWDLRIAERRARLNLAAEFTTAGRSWTEADEQGNAVVHRGTARQSNPAKPSSSAKQGSTRKRDATTGAVKRNTSAGN